MHKSNSPFYSEFLSKGQSDSKQSLCIILNVFLYPSRLEVVVEVYVATIATFPHIGTCNVRVEGI